MTISPEFLLTVAAERLRAARPELVARFSTPRDLQAVKAEIASDRADEALVVVINRLRLADWVRETCRFVLSLSAEHAELWRRSFTRTIYLAGRPDNLRERFAFDHIAADGSVAWAGPAADPATTTLRRLLKTFSGQRPLNTWAPMVVEVPPGLARRPPVHRDLYVATAQVTISDVLVHLNHLIAEAVMDGLIAPGDRLSLRSVPRLTGLAVPFAALRIDTDIHRPGELQAFAGLTEEI